MRVIALVLFVCAAGCSEQTGGNTAQASERIPELEREGDRIVVPEGSPIRSRLRVEAIEARGVRRATSAPARVEVDPSLVARITPPVPGRVVRLLVHFGDSVRENQPLLTYDSPDIVDVQTALLEARVRLAQANRELARQGDLAQQGIASRADLEHAETERAVAQSELEQWESRLRLLGMNNRRVGQALTLRSPIAGRVIELAVSPGEFRSDLAQPMMTVADLSQVWLTADLQERDIGRVRVGMDVDAELAAYPGETLHGQVQFVGDLLDPERRTLPVRVVFDNADGRLRPNMFGRVTFAETAHLEIVVPAAAVLLLGDANYVFVEQAPFVFERRRVVPGDPSGNEITLTEGVRVGERIVVANAILLQ